MSIVDFALAAFIPPIQGNAGIQSQFHRGPNPDLNNLVNATVSYVALTAQARYREIVSVQMTFFKNDSR